MNVSIVLYDRETIDRLPWPDTDDGRYARRFLLPLMKETPQHYIANVRTRLYALVVRGHVLPVTVNEEEYSNSYVCSPYTHYVSYAKEELAMLRSRLVRKALEPVASGIGWLLKAGKMNRTVHVNNWLLSTNLYPDMDDGLYEAIVSYLVGKFPNYAIVFRSLNGATDGPLLETMRTLGCTMVPSRQIYILPPNGQGHGNAKARWLLKRDYSLLEKQGYEIVEADRLQASDVPRITELYNALYLHKYSFHNPQFQERFIELARRDGILQLCALRKNGKIDAVLGYYVRHGKMTTPLFGYDTDLPQETGLYRMLSAVLIDIAGRNGCLLHESSGAAQFKRNRGAVAHIEYSAVYERHLPLRRRWCWRGLAAVLERIGVPIIRKYKL